MIEQRVTHYFLGANSAKGFYSLYGGFCRPESGVFLWVIKGGPGCGKSSFMKTIGKAAEQEGLAVEYVWCSGDPDSLDAVYVPAWKTAYADGTAPHVLEVACPAASGLYLDLGRFYDRTALQPKLAEILALQHRNRALSRDAYTFLAAAAEEALPVPEAPALPDGAAKRFLRAVTCRGLVGFDSVLEDADTLPSPAAAARLADSAIRAGYQVVLAMHPVFPELPEAVIVPESGRVCRVDLAALDERLAPGIAAAAEKLAQAKLVHDELEALYNPHVDFEGVYALAKAHALKS